MHNILSIWTLKPTYDWLQALASQTYFQQWSGLLSKSWDVPAGELSRLLFKLVSYNVALFLRDFCNHFYFLKTWTFLNIFLQIVQPRAPEDVILTPPAGLRRELAHYLLYVVLHYTSVRMQDRFRSGSFPRVLYHIHYYCITAPVGLSEGNKLCIKLSWWTNSQMNSIHPLQFWKTAF